MLDNFGYEDILRTKNNVRKTISGLYCTRVDRRSRLYEISCPFFKSRTFVVVASCSTFILHCFKDIVIYLERFQKQPRKSEFSAKKMLATRRRHLTNFLDDPTVKSSFCSWSSHQIFFFGCSKVVSTCSKRNTLYSILLPSK